MISYVTDYVMKKDKKRSEFLGLITKWDKESLYTFLQKIGQAYMKLREVGALEAAWYV